MALMRCAAPVAEVVVELEGAVSGEAVVAAVEPAVPSTELQGRVVAARARPLLFRVHPNAADTLASALAHALLSSCAFCSAC